MKKLKTVVVRKMAWLRQRWICPNFTKINAVSLTFTNKINILVKANTFKLDNPRNLEWTNKTIEKPKIIIMFSINKFIVDESSMFADIFCKSFIS